MPTGTEAQEAKKLPEQLHLLPPGKDECRARGKRTATAAAVATVIRKRRYKEGPNRAEPMLLPPSVEDYVAADNAARAIKAYVGTVDLKAFEFKNAEGEQKAGQPTFSPADLLGLYLYGYLNRVRSSRRLEAECAPNLEVIWLLNGLRPGYHTIADFRKNNPKALKKINSDFIALCGELGLFGGKLLGIDGSFFNGSASHASVKTKKQLESELAAIERDIERYQQALDNNDATEANQPDDAAASAIRLAALETRTQQQAEVHKQQENEAQTRRSRTESHTQQENENNDGEVIPANAPDLGKQSVGLDSNPPRAIEVPEPSEPHVSAPVSGAAPDSQQASDSHDTTEASSGDAAVITAKLDTLKAQAQKKTKQITQLEKTGKRNSHAPTPMPGG